MIGTVSLDLRERPGNRRNGEGAFITLQNGDILYVYSRFCAKEVQDHDKADIASMRSRDGGCHFGEERILYRSDDIDAENIMSVSLLRMQNGDIGLFYLIRQTLNLMRLYIRRSCDEGETFGLPTLVTNEEGFFVVNNDRVIRLQSGRIVVPAAVHRKGFREERNEVGEGFYDSNSDCVFFLSDDDGLTWFRSEDKLVMPHMRHCKSGLQEPGVLELAPNVLWGWARTDLGRQYEFFSHDGGNTWTQAQPSAFTGPNSPLSMKYLSDGRIMAVWNPIPVYNGRAYKGEAMPWYAGRTPLVYTVGLSEQLDVHHARLLETGENHQYSYVTIHPLQDAVLLAYYAGPTGRGRPFTRLVIRKIPLEEL